MSLLRTCFCIFLALTFAADAQSPKPTATAAASPAASAAPTPPAKPVPSSVAPSATPTTEELINSLGPADVQAAISLLKTNFTKPEAINETDLNRATLQGLLVRLGHGLMLLPEKANLPPEANSPFYSDVLEGHIGYLRLGSLTAPNLQALDKKLAEFAAGKKVDALVIDLRSSAGSDFNVTAEFAKRFVAKGKTLFSLQKHGKTDRVFTSDRDPSYQGLIALLVDGDTAGGGEALAATIHLYEKALLIGQNTAGRAAEYSDLPLPSGKILRVAISEAVGPDSNALFPDGLKADLPVEMAAADKRQIFQLSAEKGMAQFVTETERPHLNEAALIAGTNPELETSDQRRNRNQDRSPRDAVLQRALDLVTSLEIFTNR